MRHLDVSAHEVMRAKPVVHFPSTRAERFRRLVALFERDEIEDAVDALIAYLDARDGDTDLESPGAEDNFEIPAGQLRDTDDRPGCPISDPDEWVGDEQDGNGTEDEPCAWFDGMGNGAGCPIADPGGDQQDADAGYTLAYSVDQTHSISSTGHAGWEVVPDFPCSEVKL